jgi:hypothetical protein
MDVLAAARGRPIVILAALLAATGAPSFARAEGGPQLQAVLPGAPVPLYLKAAELPPAVLLEWAQPNANQSTPIDITGLTQQDQNRQNGGGGGGGTSDTPKGQPEPASLISAFSGVGLAGLAAWLRRRRRGADDEAPPEEWPDEDEEEAGE